MKPKNVKNSDFMAILCSKLLREYKKPKFGNGNKFRNSKYDLPFSKGYKPQYTHEVFEIVAIATENLQHIQSKTNKKKLYVEKSTRRN